jgi:DNA repair ATPase RecN
MNEDHHSEEGHIAVENIGGIDETEIAFEPGVTVLAGRNATNRTSLLQAIMAALGSDQAMVKAEADEAHVELTIGNDIYTRTLERQNETIRTSGEPYLDDPTEADLFAFLLESNEARRAVTTDADLREIIMEPIDTDEIQTEIDRLVEQRQTVEQELAELDDLKGRLPTLEEERTQLEAELAETKAELTNVEDQLQAADAEVEQSRQDQAELEAKL